MTPQCAAAGVSVGDVAGVSAEGGPAMSRAATGFLVLSSLLAFAALATDKPPIPDTPENQAEIEAAARGELVLEPVAPAGGDASLSPEMAAIREALAAGQARVDELEARLVAASGDEAALAVMRAIEQAKQDTEIEVLRIQAEHARLAGRETQAQEIEAAITQMLEPGTTPTATVRPDPPANDGN
jgi:hypothetical protein